jgi:hypothetical protein
MKSPSLAPLAAAFRLLEIDLLEVVLDFLDHFDHAPQAQVAGARIKLGADVVFRAIAVARRLLDRFFHRLDDDRLVDHLLGRDRIRDRKQFGAVGGNRTGHISLPVLLREFRRRPLVSSGRVAAISRSVRTSLAE